MNTVQNMVTKVHILPKHPFITKQPVLPLSLAEKC